MSTMCLSVCPCARGRVGKAVSFTCNCLACPATTRWQRTFYTAMFSPCLSHLAICHFWWTHACSTATKVNYHHASENWAGKEKKNTPGSTRKKRAPLPAEKSAVLVSRLTDRQYQVVARRIGQYEMCLDSVVAVFLDLLWSTHNCMATNWPHTLSNTYCTLYMYLWHVWSVWIWSSITCSLLAASKHETEWSPWGYIYWEGDICERHGSVHRQDPLKNANYPPSPPRTWYISLKPICTGGSSSAPGRGTKHQILLNLGI